jgi:hypothetical protein
LRDVKRSARQNGKSHLSHLFFGAFWKDEVNAGGKDFVKTSDFTDNGAIYAALWNSSPCHNSILQIAPRQIPEEPKR